MADPDVGLRTRLARAWRRRQRGWPTRFVIVQFPNVPLLIAFAASFAGGRTDGTAATVLLTVNRVGLLVFAVLEVADGANWFRRLLGVIVLGYLAVTVGAGVL